MSICAWCGKSEVYHRSVDHACPAPSVGEAGAWSTKYKFAYSMEIGLVPIGAEIDLSLGGTPTYAMVASQRAGGSGTSTVVGWKSGNQPGYAWPRTHGGIGPEQALKQLGLDYGYCVPPNTIVRRVVKFPNMVATSTAPSVSVQSGMSCAVCQDFNAYGQPNVGPNYVCYRCRSSGKKVPAS